MTDSRLDEGEDLLLELSDDSLGNSLTLLDDLSEKLGVGARGHGASDAGEEDEGENGVHCRRLA